MWTIGRRVKRVVLTTVLTGAVALLVGGWMVDRIGVREEAPPADVRIAVVLGARVLPGGVPSGALRARVERAVGLYRDGHVDRLLFSGGVGDHPPSEASLMCSLATSMGVPQSACILEENSHSTYENARFSAPILERLGVRRVLLVSDPYHLFRARQNFRRQGIDAVTVPATLTERHRRLHTRLYWTLREVVALLRRPALLWARAPEISGTDAQGDRARDRGAPAPP